MEDKHTGDSPRQSEEKYQTLVKEAPIAIYEIDITSSKFLSVNTRFAQALGYSQEELLAKKPLDLFSNDSKQKFQQAIEQITAKGLTNFSGEFESIGKNGQSIWGLSSARLIFKDCKPDSLLVFTQDITNRKRTEEALRLSEEKFSLAFQNSPVAVSLTRLSDGIIAEANDAAIGLFGYPRKEVIGRSTLELRMWAYPAERVKFVGELSLKGSVNNQELTFCRKDRTLFLVTLSASIIIIKGEKYFLSTFIDITERKKAEEDARLGSAIFDLSSDSIVVADLAGNIIRFNDAACKMRGYTRAEMAKLKVNDLNAPESAAILEPRFKQLVEQGSAFFEAFHVRKDKSRIPVEIHASIVEWGNRKLIVAIHRDITERKKAEVKLRDSERLYRTLFDNSEDGFMLLEPMFAENGKGCDFRFLKINAAFERQTGAKATDVFGKLASEATPELESEISLISGDVAKTGKSVHHEAYNNYANRWFDSYYFSYSQNQVGILFRDITERKKAEEALRLSEERFQQMIEQSPIIFEVYDRQGFQIKVNTAYEKFWNIPKELTLGKYNILSSEQVIKNNLLQYVEQAYAGKIVKLPDYQYDASLEPSTGGQGRKRWLNAILYPLRDDCGKVTGIVVLHEDTTERKNAEMALKESEENFQSMIEESPAIFGVYDRNGFLIQVNRSWDKLWQVKREYVIGKWNILQSKQVKELGWLPLIKRAYAGEIVSVPEKEFDASLEPETLGKGRKRWLKSVIYPIRKNGEVKNIVMMNEDITDKKRLEKQLQDNERMAAIGQTAGMVGHDIRNPLQTILSETFLLKDELASMPECTNKEGVAESIDSIERNVAYINKIVQDLQDYSKQVVPEYSIADLSDVFIHVFETISVPEAINLSINVKDAEKIRIDPSLLQRAITNLVNNAIQAMPEGGKLEIYGKKIDTRIVITVSDTGVGIPDEVKPKLFTPMMTTKAKGQGFGLAASKRMIEAMKGTISFESEKGKGTKFTIKLPT